MQRSITLSVLSTFLIAAALQAQVAPQSAPAVRRGPPVQGAEEDVPLLALFDANKDKVLEHSERIVAREYILANPQLRRPVAGTPINRTGSPGPRLSDRDVKMYPASVSLYDPTALRTIFVDFERDDWEEELEAFWHTDVELPATLRVDGKTYPKVGMSFRGNNSFTQVPRGLKRQFNITMDAWSDQSLLGHTSLNLLNANQDPTFLRTQLYLDIARDYIPALKSNFVRVVINGESWGIYVNQQSFSKEFARQAWGGSGGTRWKSPNNSPGGGLSYLGDDVARYRRWYEMKGSDKPESWRALVNITKVLAETSPDKLEAALAPIVDVDNVLRFLALDVALVNGDGYWKDGSDFNLYLSVNGKLHLLPHDANEGFRAGRNSNGAQPDPLVAITDTNKALRHRLLAVPTLRDRYLAYVGDIAEKWLDWQRLGPLVESYRALIADDVGRDTRKLDTSENFTLGTFGANDGSASLPNTIKGFAELRRAALLAHPEIVRARATVYK
jgi:hypothetical protein